MQWEVWFEGVVLMFNSDREMTAFRDAAMLCDSVVVSNVGDRHAVREPRSMQIVSQADTTYVDVCPECKVGVPMEGSIICEHCASDADILDAELSGGMSREFES